MRIHEAAASPFDHRIGDKYIHDFVDYWQDHAMSEISHPNFEEDGFFNKFSITSTGGQNFINTDWKINIEDHTSTKFPFKMGKVSGMRLHMNKLATLENTPRWVATHFNIEKTGNNTANNVLTNLEGCPERADSIGFEVAIPIENLKTGLTGSVSAIWMHAPSIKSFAGLNVPCDDLAFSLTFQTSITGIHKQLTNVKRLNLTLPPNFQSGLLGLAMIPGLEKVTCSLAANKYDYGKAIIIIQQGKTQKKNVHDIQEDLIDAGLTKFATL